MLKQFIIRQINLAIFEYTIISFFFLFFKVNMKEKNNNLIWILQFYKYIKNEKFNKAWMYTNFNNMRMHKYTNLLLFVLIQKIRHKKRNLQRNFQFPVLATFAVYWSVRFKSKIHASPSKSFQSRLIFFNFTLCFSWFKLFISNMQKRQTVIRGNYFQLVKFISFICSGLMALQITCLNIQITKKSAKIYKKCWNLQNALKLNAPSI